MKHRKTTKPKVQIAYGKGKEAPKGESDYYGARYDGVKYYSTNKIQIATKRKHKG